MPFGFNHVPHTSARKSLHILRFVFIAFRLQPRSARNMWYIQSQTEDFVFIAFRLQPRSAHSGDDQHLYQSVWSSLPFGFNHVPHKRNRISLKPIVPSLHCLSASTTFRTQSQKQQIKSYPKSSLPFGFNHVPHSITASLGKSARI